ncbi:phage tail sheath family protein [Paraburkholderia sp.]|uniref:phage tail sheath family protein n=1 Tax=Paraburkholderia sp. TaxID=1926495 RepID=UPI003D6DCAFF
MPASFLHGVETIETTVGGVQVTLVKTAVVGLVGTAAGGTPNQLTLVSADTDFAQFGPDAAGFTIRSALQDVFDQKPTVVQVINVLDPLVHNSAAAAEAIAFDATDTSTLTHPGVVMSLPYDVKSKDGNTTYKKDIDYTIDPLNGIVSRVAGGAIAPLAQLTADYSYADPTKVTPADIIGGINAAGLRTGMQLFKDGYSLYGYFAKLLVAPAWSTQASVSAALTVIANNIRAMQFSDAPGGLTVPQAISARGPAGTINFDVSDERTVLLYPYVSVFDTASNANVLRPLSARAAGIQSKQDQEKGYWWSPSNVAIQGIVGTERPITSMVNDPNCEANQLNAAGIVTVFSSYGTGLRLWGNRSSAYPASTQPTQFICVRRTADIIEESLEYFTLQYTDGSISNAWIDTVLESANGFMRKLGGDGAILGGRAWYDPTKNPVTELEGGHIVFSYDFMPPPPAERITYQAQININYLSTLTGSTSGGTSGSTSGGS